MDLILDPANDNSHLPDWTKTILRIPDETVVGTTIRPISTAGHFADLYAGYHVLLGMTVALKQPRRLEQKHINRFFREGYTWGQLQRLQHPNILPFLGVIFIDDVVHLVSPFMGNGSLDEFLTRCPDADRVDLLRQAAGAVAHMHDLKMVHGDIKANNILVTMHGRVLLCDFGLAQMTELQGVPDAYSSASCGNARWAAPELVEGELRSSETDIWAFGMTIYEVIHGKTPYYNMQDLAVVLALVKGKLPEPAPHLAHGIHAYARLWAISVACWQSKPEMRLPMKEIVYRLGKEALRIADSQLPGDEKEPVHSFNQWIAVGTLLTGDHPEHGVVALKPFRQSPRRRANHHPRPNFEAELWASLNHPNLLPFLGLCVVGARLQPFLMSPYMEQGTISEYIANHPHADRARMCVGIADGIAYLHDELIVHGGIKAANILMSGRGRPLVAGFSSAMVIGGFVRERDELEVITYRWSSPELIQEGPITFTSDVFAFGMTMYEILSTTLPFNNIEDEDEVKDAILAGNRPGFDTPNSVPAFAVAESCWQSEPVDRPSMRKIASEKSKLRWTLTPSEVEWKLLERHREGALAIAFSSDGSRVGIGRLSTVQVWDMDSGVHLMTLDGHDDGVRSVAFALDGSRLASGSFDSTVRIWDAVSGEKLAKLKGHIKHVTTVTFSMDGLRLASGSADGSVHLWKVESGDELATMVGHTDQITSVAFSPDGLKLASGSFDSTVVVWDLAYGMSDARMLRQIGSATGLAFASLRPESSSFGLASHLSVLMMQYWEASSEPALVSLRGNVGSAVLSVAFSSDGSRLAMGLFDSTAQIWDTASGKELSTCYGHTNQAVWSVAFSPDGSCLASGSEDATVRIWNTVSGVEMAKLRGHHNHQVTAVAFSQNGSRLTSGSNDWTVLSRDIRSGAELTTLRKPVTNSDIRLTQFATLSFEELSQLIDDRRKELLQL